MSVQTELQPLTNRDLFSNYYLENLLPETDTWQSVDDEEIRKTFKNVKEIYEETKESFDSQSESSLQGWYIEPILEELGFVLASEETVERSGRQPDLALFKDKKALDEAFEKKDEDDFYKRAISLGEAKRWDRNLDKRGDVRDFTNPSHQVHVYLQETPLDWGILTNGKKWRVYYSKTSHRLDSYYEIDLSSVLEREDLELFKYFYLLFRSEAFVEDNRGECFLDKVYDKSNLFSQELGEDLKENIYEAIRLLAEGFLDFSENDIDPEDDLELIHDSSLIYLYRLIFILYAESEGRELLDTSNMFYNEHYSLNTLKQEVCEDLEKSEKKYTSWRTDIWDDLEELFELIDKGSESKGIPEDELYVPAYNGGLFKTEITEETSDEAEFLQKNKVADSYLAEVIDLLTRHESQNGDGRVFVDYSSLDIRHLGSIYEGLLEYHLNVASEDMIAVKEDKEEKWYSAEDYDGDETVVEELEEGEVYLTTDKGERKATGSYYTPEYIVQYIVENTLDPILDEIREDLLKKGMGNFANDFAERVFELKVLDPAMGSGHFLTNAVDHLAREIVNAHEKQAEELGAETVDESHDIHWARRQVAQKCIYGVDLNDMAVELAKVSLWLRTLAAQKPLAFLDHHLKTGNSLIGSDIEDIEELDSGKKKESEVNSTTLEDFGMTKKGTMEDLMSIYQDFIKIENQELSDIKEMEEKYHKFEHEPIKERLEAIANVHTAREFGVDVPDGAFSSMASAVDDESKWRGIEGKDWFDEAQELAGNREFFHWKLAFPEVFYEDEGGKKEDDGFDVVIGNPPYARIQSLKENFPEMAKYYEETYESSTQNFDIYVNFTEKGYKLLNKNGLMGYIEPHKFFQARMGKGLRKIISENKALYEVTHFGEHQVFPEASVYTCLLFLSKKPRKKFRYLEVIPEEIKEQKEIEHYELPAEYNSEKWIFNDPKTQNILAKIDNSGKTLAELTRKIFVGLQTSADKIYLLEKIEEPKNGTVMVRDQVENKKWELETEMLKPALKGDDVHRYQPLKPKYWVIFPYNISEKGADFIRPETVQTKYPKTWGYLKSKEEQLRNREGGKMDHEKWYEFGRLNNLDEFEQSKILTPEMSNGCNFTYDSNGLYHTTMVYSFILDDNGEIDDKYLLSILNNNLLWFFLSNTGGGNVMRGGYFRFKTDYLNPFSVPDIEFKLDTNERKEKLNSLKENFSDNSLNMQEMNIEDEVKHDFLAYLADKMIDLNEELDSINLKIEDYLGNYSEGKNIDDFYIPIEGVSETILTDTAADREKLRIGSIEFEESNNELTLKTSARYKPENEEQLTEDELDRWGYTETELIPAMKFTGSERELALIREFTKLAVDKAGRFANFRESATKTMSILDRLGKLTLPKLEDVEKGLEKYLKQKEKAERLEEEIKETDHTIDAIVFDLYDLTEEEVEVVLDSLDTDEEEKVDIMGKYDFIKN